MPEVVFVSMPFSCVLAPSIGLSIIKAGLERRRINSTVHYFSIRFAELVGMSFYTNIGDGTEPSLEELAGDWIFSGALFGTTPQQDQQYVDEILVRRAAWTNKRPRIPSAAIRRILRIRSRVDRFLDWCLERVLEDEPRVLGFTSASQQHVASLALARRIKRRRPDLAIIFGGPNCADVMGAETVRQFPFVDVAISGEGDFVGPEVIERLLVGRSLDGLNGVRTFREVQSHTGRWSSAPLVENLDSIPIPDYSDFFKQFRSSRLARSWRPTLLFESSRGCWWGQKSQCTFCGLNAQSMRFRSKSAGRALDEIRDLKTKYPQPNVVAVDTILDLDYFDTFIPELAKARLKAQLFYETKSNLSKAQVRMLRDAGVLRIQPGIESFSDSVLKRMRKGVTALQNIQLLKWCREFGIRVYWNFLWGFPGEDGDEYRKMSDLVPLLTHLQPPFSAGDLRLERFSPSFDHPSLNGLTDVRPLASYRFVYQLPEEAIRNLAYFFSYRRSDGRWSHTYAARLLRRLQWWHTAASGAAMFSVELGGSLLICDVRPRARRVLTALSGVDRAIYLGADSIASANALSQSLDESQEQITRRLDWMVSRKLMIRDGSRYLSLAIPVGEYQPGPKDLVRFQQAIRKGGTRVEGGTRIDLSERVALTQREHALRKNRRHKKVDSTLFLVEGEHSIIVRDYRR